jgi:hypothetical protein
MSEMERARAEVDKAHKQEQQAQMSAAGGAAGGRKLAGIFLTAPIFCVFTDVLLGGGFSLLY